MPSLVHALAVARREGARPGAGRSSLQAVGPQRDAIWDPRGCGAPPMGRPAAQARHMKGGPSGSMRPKVGREAASSALMGCEDNTQKSQPTGGFSGYHRVWSGQANGVSLNPSLVSQ